VWPDVKAWGVGTGRRAYEKWNPFYRRQGLSVVADARVFDVLSLASLSGVARPESQLRRKRRWVAKFSVSEEHPVSDAENPVAVEVLIKNDAGSISGTAAFYVIRNKDNKPQVVGKTESNLIDPQFDGTTLKFSVKSKGQQPGTTRKVEMQMKLLSDTDAELENLEDSSGPVFTMKKMKNIQ
jgi:hypothetical protein